MRSERDGCPSVPRWAVTTCARLRGPFRILKPGPRAAAGAHSRSGSKQQSKAPNERIRRKRTICVRFAHQQQRPRVGHNGAAAPLVRIHREGVTVRKLREPAGKGILHGILREYSVREVAVARRGVGWVFCGALRATCALWWRRRRRSGRSRRRGPVQTDIWTLFDGYPSGGDGW